MNAAAWRGLVLAGGESSRMGRDKAQLRWRGQPLWQWMRELLLDAGAHEVLVSGPMAGAGAIPGAIPDARPGGGPVAALAQLAPRLADGAWLVVPVDMPLLTRGLFEALLQPQAACVHLRGHALPTVLRLAPDSRAVLAQLAATPGRGCSFRHLQERLRAVALDETTWRAQLANCNTPAEWRALQDGAD